MVCMNVRQCAYIFECIVMISSIETEQLLNSKDMEHNIWNNIQRDPGLFISETGKYENGAVLEKEDATMVIRFRLLRRRLSFLGLVWCGLFVADFY